MQISRLDTLKQREEKVKRYRLYATKDNNLLKAKQADFIIFQIKELSTLISQPKQWT